LSSREVAGDRIAVPFQQYLNRPVDSTGLSAFTTALQGTTTLEVVIANLIGSDEFYHLAMANRDAGRRAAGSFSRDPKGERGRHRLLERAPLAGRG
jgi:hypothetical protein